MRTSARRLRTAVQHLAGHLGPGRRRGLLRQLKGMMRSLAPLRDLDVLSRAISGANLEAPEAGSLQAAVDRRKNAARRRAASYLSGPSFASLVTNLESADGTAAAPSTTAVAPERIFRCIARALELRPASWETAPAELLHETRKAVKRMRYALEIFRPLYGRPVGKMIERCRVLQGTLGAVQDSAMFARLLKGNGSFAAGKFLGLVEARSVEDRARIPGAWDRAFGPKTLGRLGSHLLRRAAQPRLEPANEPLGLVSRQPA